MNVAPPPPAPRARNPLARILVGHVGTPRTAQPLVELMPNRARVMRSIGNGLLVLLDSFSIHDTPESIESRLTELVGGGARRSSCCVCANSAKPLWTVCWSAAQSP